ncbi:MAG: hypothetical protein IKC26_03440 [Clostridia bacterium]|nr:hypothetical protein [Clostridia bacterium]MBR2907080.1 hypothetical protein [Clostridia bacterium]
MKKSVYIKRIATVCLILLLALSMLTLSGCGMILDWCEDVLDAAGKGNGGSGGGSNRDHSDMINSIGGVSDTYKGTVSAGSYSSMEVAAEAYVTEQLFGSSSSATINEIVSLGALSSNEAAELGIPKEYVIDAQAVERVEVTYTEAVSSDSAYVTPGVSKIDTLNTTKKIEVYVIKYEYDWKYFSPCPTSGDKISLDYYNSVFGSDLYENCTMETTIKVKVEVDGASLSDYLGDNNIEVTMTQLIKHADNKVYLEQSVETNGAGMEQREVIYAYLEEINGRVQCYVKINESGEWYDTYLSTIGFDSIEELTPFYDQYLDHTYFTKADYGFTLSRDSARYYLTEALEGMDGIADMINIDGMGIDMYADYYVKEGVLTGMDMNANLSMEVTEGGETVSMTEIISSKTVCKDYGSTVVTKPFAE